MDFTPVPAGTAPAAALTLRGPDPDLVYLVADPMHTVLSDAFHARNGVAANQRLARYSRAGGILAGGLFTRDPAVLAAVAGLAVVAPAKLHAHFLQLTNDGLPIVNPLTAHEFAVERETIIDGLDLSALAAGYLVTLADTIATEPHAGGAVAAGSLYLRVVTNGYFAVAVDSVPGLYRLQHLGDFYTFAPGLFLAASRDRAGQPYRVVLEQCRQRAEELHANYATTTCGYPMGTAEAAAHQFCNSRPGAGWELPLPPVSIGNLFYMLPPLGVRLALSAPGGDSGSTTALAFRQTLCAHAYEFDRRIPSLLELLQPAVAPPRVESFLARLCGECFKPARPLVSCLDDVLHLEGMVKERLHFLR